MIALTVWRRTARYHHLFQAHNGNERRGRQEMTKSTPPNDILTSMLCARLFYIRRETDAFYQVVEAYKEGWRPPYTLLGRQAGLTVSLRRVSI